MEKTYKIEWKSSAAGWSAYVYVSGGGKGKCFNPNNKKDPRTVRERVAEYVSELEKDGYTEALSQIDQAYKEVVELGGDTSVLLENMPVRVGHQIVTGAHKK